VVGSSGGSWGRWRVSLTGGVGEEVGPVSGRHSGGGVWGYVGSDPGARDVCLSWVGAVVRTRFWKSTFFFLYYSFLLFAVVLSWKC